MSELTLAQLLAADPGPFRAAAGAWRDLAQVIDQATEDLITVGRTLPEAWAAGVGAEAGRSRLTALGARCGHRPRLHRG